jgi:electron transfer flavoprotein beta subunit
VKIVVCIKQVPSASQVKIDPETNRLVREGIRSVVNPYDLYALQWAVDLRERAGFRISALSMGPKSAENSLYEALSFGADEAFLLTDRAFGGSDTWATSMILAEAVRKIGDVGIVLCGKQAIDGDTAQVGPGIAAHLGWAQATYVTNISSVDPASVTVERTFENSTDCVICRLPAVVAVEKRDAAPRVPTLKDWLAAVDKQITRWGAGDLGIDVELAGLKGSPTRVVKTSAASFGEKQTVVIKGTPAQSATQLFIELARRSLY